MPWEVSGWFRMLAAAAAMLAATGSASAQPFPSKPVHILVPYAAGGAVDILSRTLGDAVSQQWHQSVIIENRPGAGGVIASQALATSPPDGYYADRGGQRPSHQRVPVRKAALRYLQGFHADLAIGVLAEHPFGARRLAVQDALPT